MSKDGIIIAMSKNHPNRGWRSKTRASLVRSWLEMELDIPGRTRADALRDLNEELGSSTSNSRLNEWLHGDIEPSRDVRSYMLHCVIGRVLREHDVRGTFTAEQLDAIADALS